MSYVHKFTGLKFWKVGSRKIYAVEKSILDRLVKGKRKKRQIIEIPDSSSETEETKPPSKRSKILDDLVVSVKGIRHDLNAVLALSKDTKLPPGLYAQLKDTFKCRICHSTPMSPPIIFSRCCRSILGCDVCVDRWYAGEDGRLKTCPLCRAERAFSETGRLHGLDDFLVTIRSLVGSDDNPGPSGISTAPLPPAAPDSDDEFQ